MNKTERDKLAQYVSDMINSPTSTISEVDRGRMMLDDFDIKVEYASYANVTVVDNAVNRITVALRDYASGDHAFALTAIQVDDVKRLVREYAASNLDDDDKIWDIVSDYQDAKGWSNVELDQLMNQTVYNLSCCVVDLISDPVWVGCVMNILHDETCDRDMDRRYLLLGHLDLETEITNLIENCR